MRHNFLLNSLGKLFRKKWFRTAFLLCSLVLLFGFLLVIVAEIYVHIASRDRMTDDASLLPVEGATGMVLGCAPLLRDGRPNAYFTNRINAASELWKSGKINAIIVSGDNSSHGYNEPMAMKMALVKKGVPRDRIVCDYAGLRTLDSIVRAREIFGVDTLVIVSQRYHNQRALGIARHYDLDARALNADNVNLRSIRLKNWIRERGARVMMLLDLWVLKTGPRHLGEKESLPPTNRHAG